MNFNSLEFIFIFLPMFLAAYYVMPAGRRNIVLLAGSILFYLTGVWNAPQNLLLMVLSVIVNWLLGIAIERFCLQRKIWLCAGIIFNFGILFLYKYAGLYDSLTDGSLVSSLKLVFPLGISFNSFRAVAYLADVSHAKCFAEDSLTDFAAWYMMFPTVTAGPITEYSVMRKELHGRTVDVDSFIKGFRDFVFGLGFKALLAGQLGAMWSGVCAIGWDSVSSALAWLAIIAYSLYIYFDFAGYSLMAIGIGRMLGFTLPENFRTPYMSKSMTEFWRRWHITLGTWFRKHIYIPLGGNRVGRVRLIFNLLAVWVFTGIWHGSTLNFLLWGLFLFAVLMLEKFVIKKYLDKYSWLGHIYMALLIPLSWTLFAFTNMRELGESIVRLFPFLPQGETYPIWHDWLDYFLRYWKYLIPGLVCCTGLPFYIKKKLEGTIVWDIIIAVIFVFSVWIITKMDADPFMYGQF
ncbi:MAG: MBOAT family protein [Clostridia bacterium]|nr:MBOAT family protein [Clostridia bacterium]